MPSATWELAGVPYTSMGQPGGIAHAIALLRDLGLAERLAPLGVGDAGDLQLIGPTGVRGPSGVLNEPALHRLVEATRERVLHGHGANRRPLLVGGDCPVLLGAVAAIGDAGESPGLIMLDGHEDAWPPALSPTGEGSDSEIAIALGRVAGLPDALVRLLPRLDPTALAYLGPRDSEELASAGVESLRDEVSFFLDDAEASAALKSGRNPAAEAIGSLGSECFWLHVDLDVLATQAFAAVDYPQAGGLSWEELDRLTATAAGATGCRGVSVAIYNPDLDPNRDDAEQLIGFLTLLIERSREGG